MLRRVLPVPPGPIKVTRRTSWLSINSLSAAICALRPMNGVGWYWKVVGVVFGSWLCRVSRRLSWAFDIEKLNLRRLRQAENVGIAFEVGGGINQPRQPLFVGPGPLCGSNSARQQPPPANIGPTGRRANSDNSFQPGGKRFSRRRNDRADSGHLDWRLMRVKDIYLGHSQ